MVKNFENNGDIEVLVKDYINKCVNANQIEGLITMTGKLCFFEDGYVFKAQGVNSVINSQKIKYQEISEIRKRNTLGTIIDVSVHMSQDLAHRG